MTLIVTIVYVLGGMILGFVIIIVPIIWLLMRKQEKKDKKLAEIGWRKMHDIPEPIKLSFWKKMKLYFKGKPKPIQERKLTEAEIMKQEIEELKRMIKLNDGKQNTDPTGNTGTQ
jgi:hypothetical protein